MNTVLKDRSSKNEREREGGGERETQRERIVYKKKKYIKKEEEEEDHGAMSTVVMNRVKQLSINVKLQVQHLSRPDNIEYCKSLL